MSKKSSSIVWAVVLCGLAMLLALGGGQWLWHFICECTPCNKIRVYLKKLCVKGSLNRILERLRSREPHGANASSSSSNLAWSS